MSLSSAYQLFFFTTLFASDSLASLSYLAFLISSFFIVIGIGYHQLVDTVADPSALMSELPGNMKALSDSCLVVDALGASARRELLQEFVQAQLQPYERLFGPEKQHYSLDQVR
jgi:hypothetical protein